MLVYPVPSLVGIGTDCISWLIELGPERGGASIRFQEEETTIVMFTQIEVHGSGTAKANQAFHLSGSGDSTRLA